MKRTYCDCCDTGEKGNCKFWLKRSEPQVRSFIKLDNSLGCCDAIYDLDKNIGYFIEFKNIDKFIKFDPAEVIKGVERQLKNAIDEYVPKFNKNHFFLAYDMNPLPNGIDRSAYDLSRFGRFQIIPRAREFDIVAGECQELFYILRDIYGLTI
ncbi:MAG: hypothetical protein FWG18_00165 [Alphaproteobacteria bacterium]|nr:hypothetical protein [Alphaproteobacteria bacterium]